MENNKFTFRSGILTFITVCLFLHAIWRLAEWKDQGTLFWTFYFIGHFTFFWFVSGAVATVVASVGFSQFHAEHEDWFNRIIYPSTLYPYMSIHLYLQSLFIE